MKQKPFNRTNPAEVAHSQLSSLRVSSLAPNEPVIYFMFSTVPPSYVQEQLVQNVAIVGVIRFGK